MGLDPFILLGLETFAFAVAGWLAGPLVGEALFRALVVGRGGAGEFQSVSESFFLLFDVKLMSSDIFMEEYVGRGVQQWANSFS